MSGKLCVIACEILSREVRTILESEGLKDIKLESFPVRCYSPEAGWKSMPEMIRTLEDECTRFKVIGGSCLAKAEGSLKGLESLKIDKLDQCFYYLTNRTIVDSYFSEGKYVVTPGWLPHWEDYMKEWGFDRTMAREYFGESLTGLLLLDTGVDDRSLNRLGEFSDFINLPYEILPIGLDYLRQYIMMMVYQWRLEQERESSLESMARATRQSADYEMAFELVNSLAGITAEDKIIQSFLELFSALFAPTKLVYTPITDGGPGKASSFPFESEVSGDIPKEFTTFQGDYSLTKDGKGFYLRIAHQDKTVGMLEVDGIAFPEYKDHYLNIALTLGKVCGLAVTNSRHYHDLEISNAELSGYSYTVSHDLKNPLSSTLIAVKTAHKLLEGPISEGSLSTINELLDLSQKSSEKGLALIDDLLVLAKSGQKPSEVSDVEISEIMKRVIEENTEEIERRGIEVRTDEDLGRVSAHPAHLYQLFSNLIGNAIKYNLSAKPVIEVKHLGKDVDEGHTYLIRDNGPGIPPGDLENIFLPFFKGRSGGSGIGLATVDRIVSFYGGKIEAYNDNGACFRFVIKDFA